MLGGENPHRPLRFEVRIAHIDEQLRMVYHHPLAHWNIPAYLDRHGHERYTFQILIWISSWYTSRIANERAARPNHLGNIYDI